MSIYQGRWRSPILGLYNAVGSIDNNVIAPQFEFGPHSGSNEEFIRHYTEIEEALLFSKNGLIPNAYHATVPPPTNLLRIWLCGPAFLKRVFRSGLKLRILTGVEESLGIRTYQYSDSVILMFEPAFSGRYPNGILALDPTGLTTDHGMHPRYSLDNQFYSKFRFRASQKPYPGT